VARGQGIPIWVYGIMMLALGVGLVAAEKFGEGGWTWRGIPVDLLGWAFLVIGVVATPVGLVLRKRGA